VLAYRVVEWERPPELVEVATPTPGPDEVVVKVAGNGLCHSDITMSQIPGAIGKALGWRVPFTLGHEVAGWVAAIGAGVAGLSEGDPVIVSSPNPDGTCRYCVRGQDSACPNGLVGRGFGEDGGLAEHVLVRNRRHLIALGPLDPVLAGPLADAGATSYHAVRRVLPRLVPGSTAVVIGAGGLGSFAVQHLRALSPARVVAVDVRPARLEHARALGAHEVISGVDHGTSQALREVCAPDGADAVLDFVGTDDTIRVGVGAVRPFGAFGLVGAAMGSFRQPWYGGLPRDGEVFHFQTSTVADLEEVVALAREGLIRSDVERFPLERVGEAYAALESGALRGRAVVLPG
jgi:propanol-preferring alcohol dehydrogenase